MASESIIIGVPIKPFGVAKQRLAPRMTSEQRSAVGKAIGARTLEAAGATGCEVVVVTGDSGVASWAARLGVESIEEGPTGLGLNGAAAALRDHALAVRRPWMVLHADLPTVEAADVAAAVTGLGEVGAVIAPSHDGGTTALGSVQSMSFAYGPSSFHRHLRAVPHAAVIVRPGLAFDLDTVADFDSVATRAAGAWLAVAVAAIDSEL